MADLKMTDELCNDFLKLIKEFQTFMIYNMMQANVGVKDSYKKGKIKELEHFSMDQAKNFEVFNEGYRVSIKNKKIIEKNFNEFLRLFHTYLEYAGKILFVCRKDIYDARYMTIKTKYLEFRKKYNI